MTALFTKRTTCRLCGSTHVEVVVPLLPIPLATPNVGQSKALEDAKSRGQTVPMDLYLCHGCGHLQILDVIDPEVQYTNFRYTTSISLGLPEHFVTMADEVIAEVGLAAGDLVVEIGSNDGTLLRAFKQRDLRVLGIDPARQTAERATSQGIPTLATFFTGALGGEIRAQHGGARAVISNNTFANLDDLGDIIAGIKAVMADDGVFVFETSYGADVVRNTLLDTVYHEHLSYFMVRPLQSFFARNGMELVDIKHIWTKGGSIRGTVQLAGGNRKPTPAIAAMIAAELKDGLDKVQPYARFSDAITNIRATLAEIVATERAAGRTVAGYGASVGTVTLLHQFGLAEVLSCIADDNPLGDAIEGPGYRIPIVSPQSLTEEMPGVTVILAWRYAGPILGKNADYVAKGGRFVVPLPEVSWP
jgi:hypothetical protein